MILTGDPVLHGPDEGVPQPGDDSDLIGHWTNGEDQDAGLPLPLQPLPGQNTDNDNDAEQLEPEQHKHQDGAPNDAEQIDLTCHEKLDVETPEDQDVRPTLKRSNEEVLAMMDGNRTKKVAIEN